MFLLFWNKPESNVYFWERKLFDENSLNHTPPKAMISKQSANKYFWIAVPKDNTKGSITGCVETLEMAMACADNSLRENGWKIVESNKWDTLI